MNKELKIFLHRNRCKDEDIARLEEIGVNTIQDFWKKASPADLIWAITRTKVLDDEKLRKFLVMVLKSVEDKLNDPRSKRILTLFSRDSVVTKEEKFAATEAAKAAKTSMAAAAARDAAWTSTNFESTWAADAANHAADAIGSAAKDVALTKQAKWIRKNIKISDLHFNYEY